ncbi:MAG: hypothetical protein LR011_10330 [Verrucomicrobia bacterium]|nr:hypothetical protein [Verrucomicrobiota bacterium]
MDSYAAATVDLGGYRALDPLQLSESEILKRIYDKEDPMPPLDADKQLTESERDQIHKWVLSGGEYQVHWAFEAPVKPQVATVAGVHFNPIDAFIENRLQEQGGRILSRSRPGSFSPSSLTDSDGAATGSSIPSGLPVGQGSWGL